MARASQYHVFSLPPELLDNLTPRNLITQNHLSDISRPASPDPTSSQTTTGARACNVCLGAVFKDVEEQRTHFRSDWHRYNVKNRLNGGKSVSATDFARLVEDLEDSLSGSASSSEDSGSEDSDAVQNLLQKTKISRSRSPSPTSNRSIPQTALVWFHSPPSTQIGVYRAIYPSDSTPSTYLEDLKRLQKGGGEEGRKWAMFMVAGGHFAGAIVRVSKPEDEVDEEQEETGGKKRKQKKPKPDTVVLKHKTFHRYTTRRKQGGSQSLNDQAKGNAKSAGAQLRRYGETALRDDIRGLLTEWADELNQCERIWIRASTSNKRIFYDYDEAVISKGDDRLRGFPFPTRRPTQSEVSRCLLELTRVKISHFTEDALRAQDEAYLASLKPAPPKPKPSTAAPAPSIPKEPKLTKEEELLRDKWARLLDMITRGRVEALKAFWEREGEGLGGVDARIPEWTGEARYTTLLQFAVQAGQEEITRWLLEDIHADPTIEVPSATTAVLTTQDDGELSTGGSGVGRRTAYDVARTKELRDVFRRAAGAYPDWWDWFGAARVPSALSKEMEEAKDEKKKIRRKGLKDKVKEREAKEKEKEPLTPPPEALQAKPAKKQEENLVGPRRLGGNAGAANGLEGLTPEMRAKVERERRARAVEERLKKMAGK